jgi:murein DD-endopeptidase MepM/ murein hydrolase activator NlpD
MKKVKIRLLASFILVIFILQICGMTFASSKSSLQSQQSSLNSKIKETEEELNKIQEEKSTAMSEVESLITQISDYESQIDELDDQIDELNSKITEAQTNLDEAEAEYTEQEELLNERLVLMYEDGDTSYLDFVLSSDSLTDFISNYYLVSELTSYDTDLLEQIEQKKQEIENKKQTLENSKQEVATAKASKEQVQTSLKNAKASKASYVSKLSSEEKSTQAELEKYEEDKKAVTAELKKIAQQEAVTATNITSTPSSSGYIFPVAGCSKANISNKSYPSYSGHTGVDVNTGVSGKSVVAVKAGTVVTSTALKNSNGSYRSYGEYVVISHGDGTMTLYAHMLAGSRTVSAGQKVSQGQVIGTVGSTGNSTGTHLHFEVRVGGSPVNPLPYLP